MNIDQAGLCTYGIMNTYIVPIFIAVRIFESSSINNQHEVLIAMVCFGDNIVCFC